MGCGVLETREKNVPGTALLTDDDPLASVRAYGEDIDLTKLKYGKGKNSHIVLVPQPSDDPNDPLNWSQAKKWTTFLALLFAVTMSGVAGPLLSASTLIVQEEFNLTLAEAGQATAGYQILGVAVSLPFWAPFVTKFGRRLPFVVGGLIMAIGGVISAAAKTHTTLLVGRVLVGIGMSPAECLAGILVADLFYVHERGLPVALWNLALVNGINISPALSGLVTARHGWRTAAWIFAAFSFASTAAQFFLQPETMYLRKITHLAKSDASLSKDDEKMPVSVSAAPAFNGESKPHTYLQSLKLWSGVYPTHASFLQMTYRPFLLMLSPITLYCFMPYGLSITFIVLVAVSSASIFAQPPYNFGPEQSGYIWFAPFVAALIATSIAGKLSDTISKAIARRNHGIYEPEFRLPLLILFTLFSGFGYLGFGMGAQNQAHWSAPVISFGLIGFGATFGLTLGSAYLVDSFGDASSSALTAMTTMKNFISFSASYWAAPWIETHTLVSVFGTIAGIMFAIGVLTIPMYIFGKHARHLTSKFIHFRDDAAAAH